MPIARPTVTIVDSSRVEPKLDETQFLFEEARQRRKRRWFIGGVLVVVVSLPVALLVSRASGVPRHHVLPHAGLPIWTPRQGKTQAAPTLFVAGDGNGGIGVYSTANGVLIRTISPQGPGGPDQQVELSRNRQSVYFVQPTGPCSGNILSGPVSGSSAPAVVVSVPRTLALSPSPSPTSRDLAWVGVTCGPTGSTTNSTLYITNLATGLRSDLGAFSGQHSDDAISWNSDGTRLAVESGTSVAIFDTSRSSPRKVGFLDPTSGCTLSSPTFFSPGSDLALIQTCYRTARTAGASQVLVFNIVTGKPVAIVAAAPRGTTFQGLSIDASGQHILLGVVTDFPVGAQIKQLESGRLVAVGGNAPTDAEW